MGACSVGSGIGRETLEQHLRVSVFCLCIEPIHFLQMDIPTKNGQQIQHAGNRLHTLDLFGAFANAN